MGAAILKIAKHYLVDVSLLYLLCNPQAAAQSGQLPVVTESHLVLVTEPTDRKLLTREILDFCGALPFYNTESIRGQAENAGNGTMSKFNIEQRGPMSASIMHLSIELPPPPHLPTSRPRWGEKGRG